MATIEREVISSSSRNRAQARDINSRRRNVSDVERMVSAVTGGALAAAGLMRGSLGGFALAAVGSYLVNRGVTGYCPTYDLLRIETAEDESGAVVVEASATIGKSAEELYQFWRNFENLPQFMDHLESVTIRDDRRSHWVAKAPAGMTVAWDAAITEERENEYIAWRSLPGADIENHGSVRFEAAPGDRGTVVRVKLEYTNPAGNVGALVARLFGEEPRQQVTEDLRTFKQLMEVGEIPKTEGQPQGRRSMLGKTLSPNN